MVDLSIIIVSYNTKEFLKNCLVSIHENVSSNISYEVIVVDNASTDGTEEEISNIQFQISNFKFLQNRENLGFSKANNLGVKQAKGRYILFLNPDTIVRKQVFEEMVTFMDKNPNAGAVTCRLELVDGVLDDACHRGFPTPWNAFCHFSGLAALFPTSKLFSGYSLGWIDLQTIHEIDACAGACMLVRREAGEKAGWWDEDYFWYGEDIDFCYRLKKHHWQIFYLPTVSILHYKGVSGGIKNHSQYITTATKETKKRSAHARFEAMKIFYAKHYADQYPFWLTWLVHKGILVKRTVSSLM